MTSIQSTWSVQGTICSVERKGHHDIFAYCIWSSQVDKIMNSKFEGQVKSSWETCLWENSHFIWSWIAYRQIFFSISSCKNLLANSISILSSQNPFRVANYCSNLHAYSSFPSSCNIQLQQQQPCEPIREQNSNLSAIWLDGVVLTLATRSRSWKTAVCMYCKLQRFSKFLQHPVARARTVPFNKLQGLNSALWLVHMVNAVATRCCKNL